MTWFFIGLLGIILLGVLLTSVNKKNVFCWLVGSILFVINALKRSDFTTDLVNYEFYFNKYGMMSWTEVVERILNGSKDIVYYILGKIVYSLGGNFRVWMVILAFVSMFLVTYTIKKYSLNPIISFMMFISLNYYYFSMTGLRQSIALALVLLSWKILQDENKSFFKFLLCVCLAACFHKAAIVFLVAYFLYDSRIYKMWIWGIPLVILLSEKIIPSLLTQGIHWIPKQYVLYIESLENAAKLNWSGFFIQLFIFMCCYACYILSGKYDEKLKKLLNLMFIGVCLQVLAVTLFAEMFRLSMYFSIFGIWAVPRAVSSICSREREFLNVIIVVCLLAYFVMSTGVAFQRYSIVLN